MTEDGRAPITAIIYSDSRAAAALLARAAAAAQNAGLACVGMVQRDEPREGRCGCDMILDDLATGEHHRLSEDRGPEARGCRLDGGVLAAVTAKVTADLDEPCDLVVLNKFGKSEAEGGGLRPLIAEALARELAILIAVPWRNIESWREFAGAYAHEIRAEDLAQANTRELLALIRLGRVEVDSGAGPLRAGPLRRDA
ncbi:MAG: DUF2478 domain-containing protein [Hyphomicrobiaceae bacterium]